MTRKTSWACCLYSPNYRKCRSLSDMNRKFLGLCLWATAFCVVCWHRGISDSYDVLPSNSEMLGCQDEKSLWSNLLSQCLINCMSRRNKDWLNPEPRTDACPAESVHTRPPTLARLLDSPLLSCLSPAPRAWTPSTPPRSQPARPGRTGETTWNKTWSQKVALNPDMMQETWENHLRSEVNKMFCLFTCL